MKPELEFSTSSNPARVVSEVKDRENINAVATAEIKFNTLFSINDSTKQIMITVNLSSAKLTMTSIQKFDSALHTHPLLLSF